MADDLDAWGDVLLSLNRALWDVVTAALRYVSVGLVDGTVVVRFGYEHPPGEDEREFVSLAETCFLSDFHDIGTDFRMVHRPMTAPRVWEDGTRWWAYLRHEPTDDGGLRRAG